MKDNLFCVLVVNGQERGIRISKWPDADQDGRSRLDTVKVLARQRSGKVTADLLRKCDFEQHVRLEQTEHLNSGGAFLGMGDTGEQGKDYNENQYKAEFTITHKTIHLLLQSGLAIISYKYARCMNYM